MAGNVGVYERVWFRGGCLADDDTNTGRTVLHSPLVHFCSEDEWRQCIITGVRPLTTYEVPHDDSPLPGPRTKRQSGAFVSPTKLVQHQVALAQQAGVLTVPHGQRRIPVINK